VNRLLDPATSSVTLDTLRRAANAVGRTWRVELA
jgi:antitoxin HicB